MSAVRRVIPREEANEERASDGMSRVGTHAGLVLNFIEGVREGWGLEEIAMWCRAALLRRGYLRLSDPLSGRFCLREAGAKQQSITTLPEPASSAVPPGEAEHLLELAREAVLSALRAHLEPGADDRLVRAALYQGRVTRAAGRWVPDLSEGQPLSAWVLALVAADTLNERARWLSELTFCEACGAPRPHTEARCPGHHTRSGTMSRITMRSAR